MNFSNMRELAKVYAIAYSYERLHFHLAGEENHDVTEIMESMAKVFGYRFEVTDTHVTLYSLKDESLNNSAMIRFMSYSNKYAYDGKVFDFQTIAYNLAQCHDNTSSAYEDMYDILRVKMESDLRKAGYEVRTDWRGGCVVISVNGFKHVIKSDESEFILAEC